MPGRWWALCAVALLGIGSPLACAQILGFDKGYVESDGGVPTSGSSVSGSATGSGGGGTGGGASGTGGGQVDAGPPVACTDVAGCPGQNTECAKRTCVGGFCGESYTAAGTAISAQAAGNCQKIVCDGHGAITLQVDDANIPDDHNPCTKDICANGTPSNPPEKGGTPCGGALTCDATGHCAGCGTPADCPGKDTECELRSCTGSLCGFLYTAAGTPVMMQTTGDCKKNVCNGMGAVSIVFDATDIPSSNNPCIIDGCSMGSPTQTNTAAGAPCSGANGGTVCDGNGACVACLVPTSCPGQDTECKTRTCTGHTCGFSYQTSGMAVSTQTPGDCKKNVCDGMGGVTASADDADAPTDGSTCNVASCSGGAPVHTPAASGTPCGAQKVCNGSGSCTGCVMASDCPGAATECQAPACTSGVCGFNYTANGTAVAAQTPGDCKKNVCNGAGGVATIADDTDVPVDGDPCTSDVCSNGTPSNPPAPAGTACTVGGTVCNGAGACAACVPGTSRFCCGVKTQACCALFDPSTSAVCDPAVQTCGPQAITHGPGLLGCCCGTTQDCDAAGHWGACY